MTPTTTRSSFLRRALIGFATICTIALFVMASGSPLRAQAVVVVVNGEPITAFDIEQRTKLIVLTTKKTPSRTEVIEDLISDKVKIKEGKRFGIIYGPAEIDAAFAGMGTRMRLTSEQLAKSLESQGVRPDTLKNRMHAEMTWSNLVRGRFPQSLMVGEKDVQSAISVKADDKQDTTSFEYIVRSIVLVVPRGASAGAIDVRRKEAEALRTRVQSCEEAVQIFRSMRDAAIREPFTKTSADLPPTLRELLDKTPIGRLTAPEVTKQGVEMVALCNRKPTTADTPAKREAREKLFSQKYEAKSKDYLRQVRSSAMIEYR